MTVGERGIYNIKVECKKCKKRLIGKQTSYCSIKCSKLHLKALYRKRNREKINKYNRIYRKKGIRGNPSTNNILSNFRSKYPSCEKCGTKEDIQICHIKPRDIGGRNRDNLITLCRKHHYEFDKLLRSFWI